MGVAVHGVVDSSFVVVLDGYHCRFTNVALHVLVVMAAAVVVDAVVTAVVAGGGGNPGTVVARSFVIALR